MTFHGIFFSVFKDRDFDQRSGRTEANCHGRPGSDIRSDRGHRSDRDRPSRSFDRPRSRSRDRSDHTTDIRARDYRDVLDRGDRDLRDHIRDRGDRDLRDQIRDREDHRGDRDRGGYRGDDMHGGSRRSFSPHRGDQQWRGDHRRSRSPGYNFDDRYSGITDLENIRDHGRSRSPDRFRVGYL